MIKIPNIISLYHNKKVIVYKRLQNDMFECYDGNTKYVIDMKQKRRLMYTEGYFKRNKGKQCTEKLEEIPLMIRYNTKYLYSNDDFVEDEDEDDDENEDSEVYTLEKTYERFTELSKTYNKICGPKKFNLSRSSKDGKFKYTIFHLFNQVTKLKTIPDEITNMEGKYIELASHGAFIYSKEYIGKTYSYDFISRYPSLMKSMKFPIKAGQEMNYKKLPKHVEYGIYHCDIAITDSRLLRHQDTKWYTHIDLMRAIELNHTITMIGEPVNAYIYTDDKLCDGNIMFGDYVDFIYNLKVKKVPYAKLILNQIWGLFVQRKMQYFSNEDLPEDRKPVKACANGYKCVKKDREFEYETDFARIKPFLLAQGRYEISKVIEPNLENLVYSHTDSVILKKRIKGIELGTELGDLKFEGRCKNTKIKNIKFKWFIASDGTEFNKIKDYNEYENK